MLTGTIIAAVLTLMAVIVVSTGRWRYFFRLFAINPRKMTVRELGLAVKDPDDVSRVNQLLASFAGGFNAMIQRPTLRSCHAYCDSLPVLFQPFAEEGLAMGYTLRHLFRFDAKEFEDRLVKAFPVIPQPSLIPLHRCQVEAGLTVVASADMQPDHCVAKHPQFVDCPV